MRPLFAMFHRECVLFAMMWRSRTEVLEDVVAVVVSGDIDEDGKMSTKKLEEFYMSWKGRGSEEWNVELE